MTDVCFCMRGCICSSKCPEERTSASWRARFSHSGKTTHFYFFVWSPPTLWPTNFSGDLQMQDVLRTVSTNLAICMLGDFWHCGLKLKLGEMFLISLFTGSLDVCYCCYVFNFMHASC